MSTKRALSLSCLALALYCAVGSLTWPLGRDQGIFTWVAQVILGGGAPYHDAWDVKGPLAYYYYAIGVAAFRQPDLGVRFLDLASIAAACWVLWRLVQDLTGDRLAAQSGITFFLLAYCGGGFWNAAQPDAWGGMLVLGAVGLLLGDTKYLVNRVGLAGAAIALATLMKPTFLAFLALPWLSCWLNPALQGRRLTGLAAGTTAFAIVMASALLLLEQHGALQDYIDVNRFNALSHAGTSPHLGVRDLPGLAFALLKLGLIIPLVLAAVGLAALFKRHQSHAAIVLAAWLLLAITVVVVQGKYWLYHWIPAVIALSVTSGPAIAYMTSWASTRFGSVRVANSVYTGLFLAIMLPVGARAIFHCYTWPAFVLGLEAKAKYERQFQTPDGKWRYSDFAEISSYLSGHSRDTDHILIWGWDPLVNVLSERPAPTRFAFAYPLASEGPLQAAYRSRFMREMQTSPPRFIVVDTTDPWELPAKPGLTLLSEFPAFSSYLHREYTQVARVDAFQIWGLNEPGH